jgi:hypothetical protein
MSGLLSLGLLVKQGLLNLERERYELHPKSFMKNDVAGLDTHDTV